MATIFPSPPWRRFIHDAGAYVRGQAAQKTQHSVAPRRHAEDLKPPWVASAGRRGELEQTRQLPSRPGDQGRDRLTAASGQVSIG